MDNNLAVYVHHGGRSQLNESLLLFFTAWVGEILQWASDAKGKFIRYLFQIAHEGINKASQRQNHLPRWGHALCNTSRKWARSVGQDEIPTPWRAVKLSCRQTRVQSRHITHKWTSGTGAVEDGVKGWITRFPLSGCRTSSVRTHARHEEMYEEVKRAPEGMDLMTSSRQGPTCKTRFKCVSEGREKGTRTHKCPLD